MFSDTKKINTNCYFKRLKYQVKGIFETLFCYHNKNNTTISTPLKKPSSTPSTIFFYVLKTLLNIQIIKTILNIYMISLKDIIKFTRKSQN